MFQANCVRAPWIEQTVERGVSVLRVCNIVIGARITLGLRTKAESRGQGRKPNLATARWWRQTASAAASAPVPVAASRLAQLVHLRQSNFKRPMGQSSEPKKFLRAG